MGTDKVRIHISLSPKVLKKLKSVCRNGDDSKSEIIEAALLQFFAGPGVFEELFGGGDESFRHMLPDSVFNLATAMGLHEGDAARLAIDQQEVNKNSEEEFYTDKQEREEAEEIEAYWEKQYGKKDRERMVALYEEDKKKKGSK